MSRFLAGSGASCGITLTGPIMADMYRKEDRGKSLALATVFPCLGPALRPIVGGLVSQRISWPWLFWELSIVDAVVVVFGSMIIRESYVPVLLQRSTSPEGDTHPANRGSKLRQLFTKFCTALARPINLSCRRPIVQLMAFIMAVEFGIYILVLSIYATLFIETYNQSPTASICTTSPSLSARLLHPKVAGH